MDLTYEEKKAIVLNKIQEHINEEKEYDSSYIEPEVVFSTTQGSVYLDSSKGKSAVSVNELDDLRGRSLRYKHVKEQYVDYGYIDITTFISKEDAEEVLRWLNEDIGRFSKVVGTEFDAENTTKTINVSFKPEEGLVPFEWVVGQDRSSNIKLNIDSKNRENSTVTLNPVYSNYLNGKVVEDSICPDFLPGFHIGHPIKEVFKEKDYFFDAVMVQSLSEKEFATGEWYSIVKDNIDYYTSPEENLNKYNELEQELKLLENFSDSMTFTQYSENKRRIKTEMKQLNVRKQKYKCPKGISDIIESQKKEKEKTKEDLEL